MSIYATLWQLKFPRDGDDYLGCAWITVIAQGVPPHIGSPTPGCGYEDGDLFAAFLPPPIQTNEDGESEYMRAVVFVTEHTPKGTARSPQEYVHPLLVLTGEAYANMTFDSCIHTSAMRCAVTSHRLLRRTLPPAGVYVFFLRTERPKKLTRKRAALRRNVIVEGRHQGTDPRNPLYGQVVTEVAVQSSV